jgi:hypothetical protein
MTEGKKKGSSYERLICKTLSKWISKGKGMRDDLLWRSASSGAVQTIHRKRGKKSYSSQAGDIAAIDPLGEKLTNKFAVECKFYNKLGLENLIMGRKSKLGDFWLVHVEKAKEVNKIPMLIARQNFGEDLLLLPNFCVETSFDKFDFAFIKSLKLNIFNLKDIVNNMAFDYFLNLTSNYIHIKPGVFIRAAGGTNEHY